MGDASQGAGLQPRPEAKSECPSSSLAPYRRQAAPHRAGHKRANGTRQEPPTGWHTRPPTPKSQPTTTA